MSTRINLICLLVVQCTGAALGWGVKPPVFKSIPTTVKTTEHDTVLLPCFVDNFGESTVRWWKGDLMVVDSSKSSAESPSNIRLYKNNTLEVSDVTSADTGDYTCQVIRPSPWGPINQHHAIQVLYPPSLKTIPESGVLEARLNEEVTIGCHPTGVPNPIISWTFRGEEIQLLNNRNTLRFTASKPSMAGDYSCTATNGVGDPASDTIVLKIVFPPEVLAEKLWVHTAPGLRIELSCDIRGSPHPKVEWLFDNYPISLGPRILVHKNGDKYSLIFRSTRATDFGFYTCRGTNNLGQNQQVIQLSGLANVAIFKKAPALQNKLDNNITLVWQVDSYSPIIEYKLLFRQHLPYRKPSNWTKLTIPADVYTPGPIYTQVYNLRGLRMASIYETAVLSRNKFGWSKPSAIFRFATPGADADDELTTEGNTETNTIILPSDYSTESEAHFLNGTSQKSACILLLIMIGLTSLLL